MKNILCLTVSAFICGFLFCLVLGENSEAVNSPKDISFTTESKEYVFEESDSLVSKEVKTIGYNREDGLFVATHFLMKKNYKGGTSQIDSIPVNLSEEQILLANGINPAMSKWERN